MLNSKIDIDHSSSTTLKQVILWHVVFIVILPVVLVAGITAFTAYTELPTVGMDMDGNCVYIVRSDTTHRAPCPPVLPDRHHTEYASPYYWGE